VLTFEASLGVFPVPVAIAEAQWRKMERTDGADLLFFGRNDVYQKGIDILLEGFARAVRSGVNVRLAIAGWPWMDSERYIRSFIESHGLGDAVRLVGPVDEKTKYDLLAAADYLVFLSRWDGPPRPILEAIAVGTPVIISPETNMGDLVHEYEAGLQVGVDTRSSGRGNSRDRCGKETLGAPSEWGCSTKGATGLASCSRGLCPRLCAGAGGKAMRLDFLNHVRYCVLHGWQGLPEYLPSDLDVIVAPEDLPHVEKALLEADGGRLVNLLQYESTCYCFVLAVPMDGEVRFLPVDVATDYRWDGRVWFTAGELLAGRQRWKDFWVASPEVEFSYLLVKKILKQDLPQHAADRLRELMLALGARAHILAEELLGKAWGLKVSRWLEEGEWDTFRDHLGRLKKALRWQRVRRDPLNPIRYWVPELGRVWRRWRDPTGLFVAVLGPDGAGKSTVIEGLRKEMAGAFRGTARFHLMPGLLRRPSNSGPVTDPHGKPPRSWLFSLLKLAYYWLDYTLGYWLRFGRCSFAPHSCSSIATPMTSS
jgi:hypothetical protein